MLNCVVGLVVPGVWKGSIAFKWASETVRPKWRYIPEDLNHQQHRCENLKTRVTEVLTRYCAQHEYVTEYEDGNWLNTERRKYYA
jgi:hypothetical protein